MTDQAVLGIVRKRGGAAGVARFSPHGLRRTFVSDLLDAGADLSTTKRLAGHSSEVTTGR
jgi:integrase